MPAHPDDRPAGHPETPLPAYRRIQGWKWEEIGSGWWGWTVRVKMKGQRGKGRLLVYPCTDNPPEYPYPAAASWLFDAEGPGDGGTFDTDVANSLEEALASAEAVALDGRCFRNGEGGRWCSPAFAHCPPPPLPEPRKIADWKWHGIFSDLMGWFSGDVLITQAGYTWIVAKMSERGVKGAPHQEFETMRAAFDAAEEILLGHTTT